MRILIVVLFLIVTSCSPKENFPKEDCQLVEISDSSIIHQIRKYIEEANLDPDSFYLTVNIASIGSREIIYISNENALLFEVLGDPSFITLIDGYYTLIFTNADWYLKNAISVLNTKNCLSGLNILDSMDMSRTYHPEVWKLTRCNSDPFYVDKSPGSLIEDHAPCGYIYNFWTKDLDTLFSE